MSDNENLSAQYPKGYFLTQTAAWELSHVLRLALCPNPWPVQRKNGGLQQEMPCF